MTSHETMTNHDGVTVYYRPWYFDKYHVFDQICRNSPRNSLRNSLSNSCVGSRKQSGRYKVQNYVDNLEGIRRMRSCDTVIAVTYLVNLVATKGEAM